MLHTHSRAHFSVVGVIGTVRFNAIINRIPIVRARRFYTRCASIRFTMIPSGLGMRSTSVGYDYDVWARDKSSSQVCMEIWYTRTPNSCKLIVVHTRHINLVVLVQKAVQQYSRIFYKKPAHSLVRVQ